MDEEWNQLRRQRQEKMEKLKMLGVDLYAYNYPQDHTASQVVELLDQRDIEKGVDEERELSVSIAGRLLSIRGHGKSVFAHIEDRTGKVQIYFKLDILGKEKFEAIDLLDLGDWLGITGLVFRTRTGEATVQVKEWTLLSKSVRQLPLGKTQAEEDSPGNVYGGFSNVEMRYRQRYADLAVNPEVREVFRIRANVISTLRKFLDDRGFLEVETPVLQPIYGGAAARPFVTKHNSLDRILYLRIADELYLKRLIVGGLGRVYEISKDFRNEGIDRFHNPEFTMLEFYQAFTDYNELMSFTESMLSTVVREIKGGLEVEYQGLTISFEAPFDKISMLPTVSEIVGENVGELQASQLYEIARSQGVQVSKQWGWGKLLDKCFGELVQPDLIQPTFVIDHPSEISPLAKAHRQSTKLTERFELFVAGEEIANAFSELNDPEEQRIRFEGQERMKKDGDEETHPIDEDYIRALEYGMPPTGGLGMGVDRLTMLIT
ncbi:MAG: lysine--tRNA ligase, partial [bacterium]